MSGKCCSPARRSPSSIVKQPLANAPPPVLFEAPGRPPSIPLSRGQVSPPRQFEGNGAPRGAPVLRNPRCLLDSAGASRRSIGGVLLRCRIRALRLAASLGLRHGARPLAGGRGVRVSGKPRWFGVSQLLAGGR